MTRSGYAVSRPRTTRKWLAAFALLSFFLQSLAVQTHVHPQLPLAKTAAQGPLAPLPAKSPAKNQDPIDQCRLCQELVHAGHFVTPSAFAALTSLSFVTAIFVTQLSLANRSATAFSWQSRAPPRR